MISGCVALECDQGIELHSYDNVVVSDCHIQSDTYGIRIHNVTACVISNVTLRGQAQTCLQLEVAEAVLANIVMHYAGTGYAIVCDDAQIVATNVQETGETGVTGFIRAESPSNIQIAGFAVADAMDSTKLVADGTVYRDWARQA